MAYRQRHITMQYNIIMYATMDSERDVFYGYEIVDYQHLFESAVGHGEGQSIIGVNAWRLREKVLLKESPADHELLQWTVKTVDRRG
jgi:hypothetical protein